MDLSGKQLLDAAPDAMVVVDASGVIVLVNRQTESLFGYSRDELLDQPVEVLLPERFRAHHSMHRQQFYGNPRARGMGEGLELFGRHKDGTEFPVEISLSPVETDQGKFVASAIRDISKRQQTTTELAKTVVRLQSEKDFSNNLIATLQGIILLLDTNGRVTLCNPFFETLTGYTATEVRGSDWFDTFIPEDERESIREFFTVVMQEGLNRGYSNEIVIKSGERRLIEWHSKTLENADGKIVGMLCTGLDVTERVATAAELQNAKEDAERATSTKTRFLAAASHDLRQPLQSLGLYLSVMTRQLDQPKRPDESKLKDVGGKMRKSLDTMGELLDALLDISKLDGGSITPEKRDVDIQVLLDRIITGNIQQAEKKGLQLDYSKTDCVVYSDPALLERVLENFVTNAIRYTEQGRVTIDCQIGDAVVRIAVRDTGVGIPKAELGRIFEEYYQIDNPVRDRRQGLGLGLSIVKHIARILDHPLEVTSIPGEGSTFAVEVPLGAQEGAQVEARTPANTARGDRESIVLFVEDDPAIVDATTMLLTLSGFQVHSASNGDEALAHVAAGIRPDIVVSDYRLPGYNGIEVIRRVRQVTADDLPTILITGDTSAIEIEAANISNCTVLRKPVDIDRLISLIENLSA